MMRGLPTSNSQVKQENVFDILRELYDKMAFADYQHFVSTIYQNYKIVDRKDRFGICNFFHSLKNKECNIIEIYGGDGSLAGYALKRFPNIIDWTNFEVYPALKPVCTSDRFRQIIPDDFPWNISHPFDRYNVLVMACAIERMKKNNILAVLEKICKYSISHIYVESTLQSRSDLLDWQNNFGFNVIDIGWEEIVELFGSFGYKPYYRFKHLGFFQLV